MSVDYVDVRNSLRNHEQRICPNCGTLEWFKFNEGVRGSRGRWMCQSCKNNYRDVIEYPCPKCDIRMVKDGGTFECRNENCEHEGENIDKDILINSLSSDDYIIRGKPGLGVGDCPVCGAEWSIGGGPDGELECSEGNHFYGYQYSDIWFCYAIWLRDPSKIRVNNDHVKKSAD